jgi:hypothetical protein
MLALAQERREAALLYGSMHEEESGEAPIK